MYPEKEQDKQQAGFWSIQAAEHLLAVPTID